MSDRTFVQVAPAPATAPVARWPADGAGGPERAPIVPAWAAAAIGVEGEAGFINEGVSIRRGARGALLTVVIPGAAKARAPDLEARVVQGYASIAAALGAGSGALPTGLHPVRFWNFIPGIHDEMEPGTGAGAPPMLSRYMVFNTGRFRAFETYRALDPSRGRGRRRGIATATGIGYAGADLVIHCLAWPTPGTAIENPRQVPAYRYSPKYGPRPPCFARGTLVSGPGGPALLIGGTASVVGEASVHARGAPADLAAQVDETLANLASLIATGLHERVRRGASFEDPQVQRPLLDRLTDVRVYHLRAVDRPVLARLLAGRISRATRVEFVRGDICRPELLVEIEGVAGARAV